MVGNGGDKNNVPSTNPDGTINPETREAIVNQIFMNLGADNFMVVTNSPLAYSLEVTKSVVIGDYDGDGDVRKQTRATKRCRLQPSLKPCAHHLCSLFDSAQFPPLLDLRAAARCAYWKRCRSR